MNATMSDAKYGLRIPSVKIGEFAMPETFAEVIGDMVKAGFETKKCGEAAEYILSNKAEFEGITFHIEIDKVTKEGEARSKETLDITGEALIERAEFVKGDVKKHELKWNVEYAKDDSILRRTNRQDEGLKALQAAKQAAIDAMKASLTPVLETPAPVAPDVAREKAKASRMAARKASK